MTDEEKAKKSLEKRKGEYWCIKTDNVYVPYTEGYKDGFAEGERIGKEKQWKATEKAQKRTSARIRELKKENKEQKKQIEKMKCCINCANMKFDDKSKTLLCIKTFDHRFTCNHEFWELANNEH